tara:strand:- start:209 stop:442 length:234 start_codon:yes stop_codon:yes gene_type:complete
MWHRKNEPPELTPQERKEFRYFIDNLIYGMTQVRHKNWDKVNFYEHMIYTFKKLNMESEQREFQQILNKEKTNESNI